MQLGPRNTKLTLGWIVRQRFAISSLQTTPRLSGLGKRAYYGAGGVGLHSKPGAGFPSQIAVTYI